MPALTITAVNTGTDQLTITAHGLNTGDGPANAFNNGNTLPAPLVVLTDYWIIRVDANTIKLATSQANALIGTAIDITTTGSGTTQILIGLPTLRNTTYTAGAQVKSADLNAFQDQIVGYRKPSFVRTQLPILGTAGSWAYVASPGVHILSSGATAGHIPLYAEEGDRIIQLVYSAFGDGVVDVTADLTVVSAAMVLTSLLSQGDSNRAAAWGNVTLNNFTPHVMAAGETLVLIVTPNAANARIGNLRLTYDRL